MRQNRRGRNRSMRKGIGGKGFDGGGEVRVRGNVHQLLERYLQLARDAGTAGDRVAAENYLQHAEHYYRVINESNMNNNRPRFNGRDLSVAAIDVQNAAPGLSPALYGNAAISANGKDNDEEDSHPGNTSAHPHNDGDQDMDSEDAPDEEENAPEENKEEVEVAAPPKRRIGRGRGRPPRVKSEGPE